MTTVTDMRSSPRARAMRNVGFALLLGLTLAAFWAPLSALIRFSFQHEHYSHIIVIPLISAALFFLERRRIFARVETCWSGGLALLLVGALLYGFGRGQLASASENDQLSLAILSGVVICVGSFVLCYGTRAFRRGLFPALFLFLMVPVPDVLLGRVIAWLQIGSAEVSYAMFELAGVPIFRTGFVFALPGVTIEVGKECSGIRSGLVLLIMSLVGGHLFLRSAWAKVVLILATLPLLIVKNGIRIVTLSLLSIYVDPGFLTGHLHRDGGILFFLLALMLLAPVLRWLQKSEQAAGDSGRTSSAGHAVTEDLPPRTKVRMRM